MSICYPQYEWITSCEWFWAGGNYIGSGDPAITPPGSSSGGNGSNTIGVGVYNPGFADEDMSDLDVGISPWSSGDVIAENPDHPITNPADFVDCFDSNSSASLTLYVAEPNPGTGDTHNGTYVGHTFLSLTQGENTSTFGFYPTSNHIYPSINNSSSSVLGNDGNSSEGYSASITTSLTSSQLQLVLDAIINHEPNYHLDNYNCTDFGIDIWNISGSNLPSCDGTWPGGGGSNPGTLGDYIRNLPSSSNINTNGGNAPLTQKSC